MKSRNYIFGILFASILLGASNCKKDPEEPKTGSLQLEFELTNGGTPMAYNDIVSLAGMTEFRMDMLRFYLSHMSVAGSKKDVKVTDLLLADASEFGVTQTKYLYSIAVDQYTAVKFGVGLDAIQNAADPVTFAASHPLSAAQSMYWSWGSKYRFVRLDGRANKDGAIGQPTDLLLAYHPGADSLYITRNVNVPILIKEKETSVLKISIDVAAFFNGPGGEIDLPTEPQTHTGVTDYEIAEKFMANFAASITVK